MTKYRFSAATVLLLALLSSCQHNQRAETAEQAVSTWSEIWSSSGDFKSPESAAVSRALRSIFVSNVNGYERNGKGFISRLDMEGQIQELRWLSGINAPTGVAVDGDTLWVVDFDRLLEIDILTRKIRTTYPSPDENPLLNDVTVAPDGAIFVTGSKTNSVYKVEGDKLVVWFKDDENLPFANGIAVSGNRVFVAAYHLASIDRADKTVEILGDKTLLFDLEGVKLDGEDGFYVSLIGDRPIYHLSATGDLKPMFKGASFVADFDVDEDRIVAPTSINTVTMFEKSFR